MQMLIKTRLLFIHLICRSGYNNLLIMTLNIAIYIFFFKKKCAWSIIDHVK